MDWLRLSSPNFSLGIKPPCGLICQVKNLSIFVTYLLHITWEINCTVLEGFIAFSRKIRLREIDFSSPKNPLGRGFAIKFATTQHELSISQPHYFDHLTS